MKSLSVLIALAAFAMTQRVVASKFKSLTTTQRNLAYQIMATWENENYDSSSKSWSITYDYCEDIDDGQGITLGFTGFTSNGGDAMDMIKQYKDINPHNAFAKIDSLTKCLKEVEESDDVGCFECEEKNCHSSTLCDAVRHAWKNDKKNYMKAQHAQDDEDNWKSSQSLAKKYNILIPLSQAFLYDSCVNHACDYSGNDVEGFIIKHALKGSKKVKSSTSAQQSFFRSLLKARKSYMCSDGCDCCEDADWRIPGWRWLGDQGYWNMPNPMSIKTFQDGDDAREYTFKCNPDQHPGCGKRRRHKGHHRGGKNELKKRETSNSTSFQPITFNPQPF